MSAEILGTVRDIMARRLRLDAAGLDLDRTFMELGGDSLSLLAAIRDLHEQFGIQVPVRILLESANTVRRLTDFLASRTDAPPQATAVARQDGTPDPAPVPLPPSSAADVPPSAPVVANAAPSDVSAILGAQLGVMEKLTRTLSDVISRQLDVLARSAPPVSASPVSAPAVSAPPVSVPPVSVPADTAEVRQASSATTEHEGRACASGLSPNVGAGDHVSTERKATPDFSLYFFGDYPARDEPDKYVHIMEAVRFGDEHGFHTAWVPERHFHSFGALFPSPSVLAAALAAQTSRIRLHAGSVVLPLHNPIQVAEEWSMIDNISGGRAGMCFASGWHANDFVLSPEVFGRHREVMYERLASVRQLWRGEKLNVISGNGEPVDVGIYPRPVQSEPPLFAAVLGNPESYRTAARHGLGIVTNLMTQSLADLAANIRGYREARASHGLDPQSGRVVVLVHTYLDTDQDTARETARGPFREYLRSSLSLFNNAANSLGFDVDLTKTTADDLEYLLDVAFDRYCAERAMIGDVAGAADFVGRLVAAGANEVAFFIDFGVPPDRMLAGLPLLAELQSHCKRTLRPPGQQADERAARQADERAGFPASPVQRRMWVVERMQPGTMAYHEPKALLIDGPIDIAALRRALGEVVARHPQLRTVFREQDEQVHQVVLPGIPTDFPVADRGDLTIDEVLASFAAEHHNLSLEEGPLFRAQVARLARDRHLLLFVGHHIIFDSYSTGILWRDLGTYYRGESQTLPELPTPVAIPAPRPEGIEFWKAALAGVPPLRLPADRPRAGMEMPAKPKGARVSCEIPAGLADGVRAMAREHGCTLFMTLLGALGVVLGQFGGTEDVVVGTAASNRPAGYENVIGMFVETLALRLDLSGNPAFGEFLRRVREWTSTAYEHSDVPFDEVVDAVNPERKANVNPLFQVMVEFESARDVWLAPDLACTSLEVPRAEAPFDLTFYLSDRSGADDPGIECAVEYNADLFDPPTVRRMLEYLESVLRNAVRSPAARLQDLGTLTPTDTAALAAFEGRNTAEDRHCLHELVRRQTERTPDAIAVQGIGDPLTYRELQDRVQQSARSLAADGIGPGDLVAVLLPRGPELIVAMLAVLNAGAVYLPVDPSLPTERIRFMLADSAAALLITDQSLDVPVQVRGIDDARPDNRVLPEGPAEPAVDDIAYCIYTSGSAGRPKGVLVPHRGPANLVHWHLGEFQPLTTLQWTSPGFDVSVQEIFTTLAAGATLTLIPDKDRRDPQAVVERLHTYGVQRIFIPATPFQHLIVACPYIPSLREVFTAGERLVITPAVHAFLERNPQVTLYNQYGPTEGSIIVTSHRVDPAGERIPPIGRPISNVIVRVLDPSGRPVPVGVAGEIHLGGAAAAAGYLGDPGLTGERFVSGFYKTGDLGRWRADGTLEFIGRKDDQVKIRGNRVEPGEIRSALEGLEQIREAAVITRQAPTGELRLTAYVVPSAVLKDEWRAELRTSLSEILPAYMIPEEWVRLEALPVNVNGKLAVDLFPEPAAQVSDESADRIQPLTSDENAVHELWCTELNLPSVPLEQSFFEVGGNSLMMVRLLERIRQRFGRQIPVADFMRKPTVRAIAKQVQA